MNKNRGPGQWGTYPKDTQMDIPDWDILLPSLLFVPPDGMKTNQSTQPKAEFFAPIFWSEPLC